MIKKSCVNIYGLTWYIDECVWRYIVMKTSVTIDIYGVVYRSTIETLNKV